MTEQELKERIESVLGDSKYFTLVIDDEGIGLLTSLNKKEITKLFYALALQSKDIRDMIEIIHFQLERDKKVEFRLATPLKPDIN